LTGGKKKTLQTVTLKSKEFNPPIATANEEKKCDEKDKRTEVAREVPSEVFGKGCRPGEK